MKKFVCLISILVIPVLLMAQAEQKKDAWQPLRFLEGSWQGTGDGMSGKSNVTQNFEFILNDQFLRMQTRSEFEPQEQNPKGEIHEDLSIISYDSFGEVFVMRAFYVEGFVNTYRLKEISDEGMTLTFETVDVENAPEGTKARLVFKKTAEGHLEQNFFVAFPGKEYGCFSTNSLKKK